MGWDNDSPIHAMTNEKLPPIFGLEALLFQGFLWLSGCCHPGHKRSASFLCYSPRTGVLSDVRRLIHEWLDGPELRNLPPEIGAHERGVRNDTDPSEIEPVSVPAGMIGSSWRSPSVCHTQAWRRSSKRSSERS